MAAAREFALRFGALAGYTPAARTLDSFDREVWPAAKLELIERAGKFLGERGCAMIILCQDDRCIADPVLRRVDEHGAAFLACQHKIRAMEADRQRMRRILRRVRERRA